jgi:hypothetical protein
MPFFNIYFEMVCMKMAAYLRGEEAVDDVVRQAARQHADEELQAT